MNIENVKGSGVAEHYIGSGDSSAPTGVTSALVQADQRKFEQEHILPPGARGSMGNPYKILRTQVLLKLEQLGTNTLAVLSSHSGAGKTLTAINLAIAIAAEKGRTALLVDLDLQNPCLSKRLGFEPKLGVEDCIKSNQPVHEALVKIGGYERLTVLPAKNRVENSSELLTDEVAAKLVQELKTRYANRIIIFDLPPVLEADDALAFSKHIGAGLFVVRESKTIREDVIRSIELMHDLKIVGTVLNGTRERIKTYY
jgi:MinD-like ATPase involved in chromosome partitioning or flagellar assembly